MYVAINRDEMGFLWAHPRYEVLMDMAHLEADCAVHVVSMENPSYYKPFASFTDLELKLLYENTTGEKYNGFNRTALEQTVWGLANRLDTLDVNPIVLNFQAQKVDEEYAGLYRFVPGAKEPMLVQDGLFGVARKQVSRKLDEEQLAQAGKLYPQEAAPPPTFAATGPDRPRASTSAAPRAPRPAGSPVPPRGSTRETIWNKADAMWEEAGKPTSAAVVLALRKRIMDALEQDGVKRTSSSNELGNWQKDRLAASKV